MIKTQKQENCGYNHPTTPAANPPSKTIDNTAMHSKQNTNSPPAHTHTHYKQVKRQPDPKNA
jgi:hypothetical protein